MSSLSKVIVITNKEDLAAAIYFLEYDKRSSKRFYKHGSNGLIIDTEQEKLLRELNIPFYVQT